MIDEYERVDNDSPWKEILEAYFPQAMQFFFPPTAALINWERPHEFLDKEFQQIARDAEQGRRYADKLLTLPPAFSRGSVKTISRASTQLFFEQALAHTSHKKIHLWYFHQ